MIWFKELLTCKLGWYVNLPSSHSVTYFFFHSLFNALLLFLYKYPCFKGIALPDPNSPFFNLSSPFFDGVKRFDLRRLFLDVVGVDEGVGKSFESFGGCKLSRQCGAVNFTLLFSVAMDTRPDDEPWLPSELPHRDDVSEPFVLWISTTWVDDMPLLLDEASKDCAPRCKWWEDADSVWWPRGRES